MFIFPKNIQRKMYQNVKYAQNARVDILQKKLKNALEGKNSALSAKFSRTFQN